MNLALRWSDKFIQVAEVARWAHVGRRLAESKKLLMRHEAVYRLADGAINRFDSSSNSMYLKELH